MAKVVLKRREERESHGGDLLSGLNPVQREAAAHINGPLLILAGAGSGKTRVLTYRVAHLIERGVQPWNILALTFTNKAAGEMQERIGKLVGAEHAGKLWVGTFHSTFARILRYEAEHLGYTSSFTIYDAEDSLSSIRKIMAELGISQQEYAPQAVRAAISNAKNKLLSWQNYNETADSLFEKQTGLVYREYEKRLRRSNSMDFDDLLRNMIVLFSNNAEVLEKYRRRFQYLLVDEYQDTNKVQYRVISMLAGAHRNVCVVGDDAQSIYRWRGADIRNILDFEKEFRDAKVVRLEQNYRSTQTILKAANDVINRNRNQIPKDLWTENREGDMVHMLSCRDDREEAMHIVDTIKREKHSTDLEFRDFAILYRTNAQSQALEDALRRANVPYLIVGGVSFYRRKEVKDSLAYLKLLVNPSDEESLLRAINEPARGIGKTTLQRLGNFAEDRNISLYEACLKAEEVPNLQKRARTAVFDFARFIRKFSEQQNDMPLQQLVGAYLDASGLLQMYKDDGSEDALDRWNNIERVLSHLAEYCERNEGATLENYLQEVALVDDSNQMENEKNAVTMMTMHAAKGLEFPVVFVAGLEKGLFPLARAEQEPDELEEERRLFYVALTRAEQKVYLSHAQRRYRFGELTHPAPSRFLSEIRPELIQQVGVVESPNTTSLQERLQRIGAQQRSGAAYGGAEARARRNAPQAPRREHYFDDIPVNEDTSYSQIPQEKPLRVGAKVSHAVFGAGKVTGLAGQGDMQRATVYFESVGSKNLVLKFAKLTVL